MPSDRLFSLPPNRYLSRHNLPPRGVTSRHSPPLSKSFLGFSTGPVLLMDASVSGIREPGWGILLLQDDPLPPKSSPLGGSCQQILSDIARNKKPAEPFSYAGFMTFSYNFRHVLGGAEEDRTPDLRIANATLSQLSYRPNELPILPTQNQFCQASNLTPRKPTSKAPQRAPSPRRTEYLQRSSQDERA